MYHLRSELK